MMQGQRLATLEDLDRARRRHDRAFFALLLAIIGIVAGVGLVLLVQGQRQDEMRDRAAVMACQFAQDNARAGLPAARAQAARDRATAAWLTDSGHHELAARFHAAAATEDVLGASRARFTLADCRVLTEPVATKTTPTVEDLP